MPGAGHHGCPLSRSDAKYHPPMAIHVRLQRVKRSAYRKFSGVSGWRAIKRSCDSRGVGALSSAQAARHNAGSRGAGGRPCTRSLAAGQHAEDVQGPPWARPIRAHGPCPDVTRGFPWCCWRGSRRCRRRRDSARAVSLPSFAIPQGRVGPPAVCPWRSRVRSWSGATALGNARGVPPRAGPVSSCARGPGGDSGAPWSRDHLEKTAGSAAKGRGAIEMIDMVHPWRCTGDTGGNPRHLPLTTCGCDACTMSA